MRPPAFLYGTAWKEDQTRRLTRLAVQTGFRGIDTANQRKHYFEEAVGQALRELWNEGFCTREDLFLQTKFTYTRGQDHRLPYDPHAPLSTQVHQSFESSLRHLHTDTIDAYLLHGPASRNGLTDGDWEVWAAMERLHTEGRVEDSRHKPPSHGIWLPSASRVRRSRPRFVLGGGALTARTGVKSVVSGGAFGLTRTGAHEGHLCPRRCRSSQQGWRSPGARRAQAVQDGTR